MKREINIRKLTVAAMLTSVAVVTSTMSFSVLGSRCVPVQHMINVLCAILLGPGYAFASAFITSFIRNILGLGSLLAFPGSMFGALISGISYKYTKNIWVAFFGEVISTSIFGGLSAYPLAIMFMGKNVAGNAFYAYIVPFLISSFFGAFIAVLFIVTLKKSLMLYKIQRILEN